MRSRKYLRRSLLRNLKKNLFKNIRQNLFVYLLTGLAVSCSSPVYAAIPNNTLPSGEQFVGGSGSITKNGAHMDVVQQGQNAAIKWKDFSIGGNASVDFKSQAGGPFNTLNYVNGGNVSQIYGVINAQGGNIFIVNPSGVQIGDSAQINVGSLYVSNRTLTDDKLKGFNGNIQQTLQGSSTTNAELMSLGDIVTGGKVTFDGDRIIIDVDRLYRDGHGNPLDTSKNLYINSTNNNVVLGYTAKFEDNKFTNVDKIITVAEGKTFHGYTWIKELSQLQAMKDKLDGYYALRNSIHGDFTSSDSYPYGDDGTKGFLPIGDSEQNKFTGHFDGLGFNIFDLNIKRGEGYDKPVGLFGYTDGADIRNFTINSGNIAGGQYTGSVVGYAKNTTVDNVINTANVKGAAQTGGMVGYAEGSTLTNLSNLGKVDGTSDVGGIVGQMKANSKVTGNTINYGKVTGTANNVGGIAGSAENSTIGNDGDNPFVIYNQFGVEGATEVGGIVGSMKDTTVQNVANYGNVLATGSNSEKYKYHTARKEVTSRIPGTTFEGEEPTLDEYNMGQTDGLATIDVLAANAGGIAGKSESSSPDQNKSTIKNATNEGDVTTTTTKGADNVGTYYNAGNIGGIVGRAEDTDLTDVTNKENFVAGAHNVGGIAGYLGGKSAINRATNNGGDITVTGARRAPGDNASVDNGFVREATRRKNNDEIYTVGNAGGIVGYMYGDDTYVSNAANRGIIHTAEIQGDVATEVSKASSIGGIVGRVDRNNGLKGTLEETEDRRNKIKSGDIKAAISDSYNTGKVEGYTGVGGIAGYMYNGEIIKSYNSGRITTTRTAQLDSDVPLNIGGIVGDSTEETQSNIYLYDVYNTGTIGDNTFQYHGRHMGGLVGRLSGSIEKAYNTGDIYNGNNVVGGLVGWWYGGDFITNVFNAGNVTVLNNNGNWRSQTGGIVGSVNLYPRDKKIINAYNLGTLRVYKGSDGNNVLGGILGGPYCYEFGESNWKHEMVHKLYIENVYTLGHLYAGVKQDDGTYKLEEKYNPDNGYNATKPGAIVGSYVSASNFLASDLQAVQIKNAHYIKPGAAGFLDLSSTDANYVIEYNDRYKADSYHFSDDSLEHMDPKNNFTVDRTKDWRLYDNTTPMLNAFIPESEKFFSQDGNRTGLDSVQYGTAFNPLQTFLHSNGSNLEYNWGDLGITGASGLSVFGNGSLTLNGFESRGDNLFFGGTIYSDGDLTINGTGNNFNLGAGSNIYGKSVNLNGSGSDMKMNGLVASTDGDITIEGGNIEILGKLQASHEGEKATVSGVNDTPDTVKADNLNDPTKSMQSIHDRFAHTTDAAKNDGNITITAKGNLDLRYGYLGTGEVTAGGNIEMSGEKIYVDTLFRNLGGDITMDSTKQTVLDLSNMGDVDKENLLHKDFLDHFKTKGKLNFKGAGSKKLAYDMWDYEKGEFDLAKYDSQDHALDAAIKELKVQFNGEDIKEAERNALSYVWVSDADQLKGIQEYYEKHKDAEKDKAETFLGYNFALKNNIDASELEDYKAIGTGSDKGYRGNFDGRNWGIFNLLVGERDENGAATDKTPETAALFDRVAKNASVKDLNVYGSTFYGKDYAGTIAGQNEGTISDVFTLGNHIEVFGSESSKELSYFDHDGYQGQHHVGAAGGIVGYNHKDAKITGIDASDSVVGGDASGFIQGPGQQPTHTATAGGIAGINEGDIGGKEANESVMADSSVTANQSTTYSLGGIAGVNHNKGTIQNAYSTGLVHGDFGEDQITSSNVGGIAGVNTGHIQDVYSEADIVGDSNVGGIVGYNQALSEENSGGVIENVVNSGEIRTDWAAATGKYTGGIVGLNAGKIQSGRNSGTVSGKEYVGGIVGGNEKDVVLSGLVNSLFATVTGDKYVGGIAGQNKGKILGEDNVNNYGKVYGKEYVGGIAGVNEKEGTIENTINEMTLYVKDEDQEAKYFGGVAGQNKGTITKATNEGNITAEKASFVGGIVGQNGDDQEENVGKFEGKIENKGEVTGKENVGGIAGSNKNKELLNRDSEENKLTITNSGEVTATNGGAGGIFYENEGDMSWVDLLNEGVVTGGEGQDNVGGIFGTNSGNATNSTFTNKGAVTGKKDKVGGIFGTNSGSITKSSMMSTVDSKVKGQNQVGGLIGENSGEVKGGRDEKNEYYKDVIYNNGSVEGASDVGGLIGKNLKAGTLDAAYNTGTVTATGDNVGGIVGTNEGKVSQVFNTIMTPEVSRAAAGDVLGANNVGGIVGTNTDTGELTDAYNTSDVTGKSNVGNAVGNNSGTVLRVYAANDSGTFFGTNSGKDVMAVYSFSQDDNAKDYVNVIDDVDKQKLSSSYDKSLKSNGSWKFYEGLDENTSALKGFSNPLLAVFLTKARYNGNTEFYYDGENHGLDIGGVTAADDLKAYNNANELLQAAQNKNVGDGYLGFWSGQIASSTDSEGKFNPNNLGYDIDATYNIVQNPNPGPGPNPPYLEIYEIYRSPGGEKREFRERKAELNFVKGGMELDTENDDTEAK